MKNWKPNKSEKSEYKRKCKFRDSLPLVRSSGPIRTGCMVKYYSLTKDRIIEGTVINHNYGEKTNQHTFTIQTATGKILVKGRNLYPNLLEHKPGINSK